MEHGRNYEEKIITPDMAKVLLATQPEGSNRRLSRDRVLMYAGMMRRGKWRGLNGATIAIDQDGVLLDGQHRLAAIVESGIPVLVAVVSNVPREDRWTIDGGKSRTNVDIAMMDGHTSHAKSLTSAATWLFRYDHPTAAGQLARWAASARDQIRDIIIDNPGLIESVSYVGSTHDARQFLNQGMAGFVHFMARKTSPEKADWFMARLKDGVELSSSSPIYMLRNQLQRQAGSKQKWDRARMCAVMVKAWLLYEAGQTTGILKWVETEAFPRFRCDKLRKAA